MENIVHIPSNDPGPISSIHYANKTIIIEVGNPDDPCTQNCPPQDCPPMYAILRWASVRFTLKSIF